MNATEHRLLPVGTIVAYAGTPPTSLAGWLVCNGADYTEADQPELAAAIGTTFGTSGAGHFNVPLLCGKFARAVAAGAATDPGRDRRIASQPGGAVGDAIGSAQTYGTAPPTSPFSSEIPLAWVGSARDDDGCGNNGRPGKWEEWEQLVPTQEGGDLESRPVNKDVWWLIKSAMKSGSRYVTLPAGSVLAHASSAGNGIDHKYWVFCDGTPVTTAGVFKSLHQAIGFAHGRAGEETMVLPDYRGWFLRGVDDGKGNDPDAAKRTAPYPTGTDPAWQGNTGDAVGSAQGFATGLPYEPMLSRVHNLPRAEVSRLVPGSVRNLAGGFLGATPVNLTPRGGDLETRPVNLAVDWHVCKEKSDGQAPEDRVPVGAILMLGGAPAASLDPVFLPCDGRVLTVAEYGELFAVIGNLYGGDPVAGTFAVPDVRGRFLRGADRGTGIDPNAATREFRSTGGDPPVIGNAGSYQDFATAKPVGASFIGKVNNVPTSRLGTHGVTQTGRTEVKGDLGLITCNGGGGDGDTRPINLNVGSYIKAKG